MREGHTRAGARNSVPVCSADSPPFIMGLLARGGSLLTGDSGASLAWRGELGTEVSGLVTEPSEERSAWGLSPDKVLGSMEGGTTPPLAEPPPLPAAAAAAWAPLPASAPAAPAALLLLLPLGVAAVVSNPRPAMSRSSLKSDSSKASSSSEPVRGISHDF